MAVVGTGTIGSVSGLVDFTSATSYDYFSGNLTLATTYTAPNQLQFGKRCREVHIVNPTASPIQFRFTEWFGTSVDGGQVPPNDKIILRQVNRSSIELRCDAGAIAGAYVMAF